ncbi:MAG: sulfatase-like hydrolase/transferase [Verrucomicrobiota bacterium]
MQYQKLRLRLLYCLIFSATSAFAQNSILIDFSKTSQTVTGNWNNVFTTGGGSSGNFGSTSGVLIDNLVRFSDSALTGVALNFAITGSGLNQIGIGGIDVVSEGNAAVFPQTGAIPDNAQTDVCFILTESTLTFSGLNDSLLYDVSFQSWTDDTSRDPATFTVQPGESFEAALVVDSNDSPSVYTFSEVPTDGSGNIEIRVQPGNTAASINAIELSFPQVLTDPPTIAASTRNLPYINDSTSLSITFDLSASSATLTTPGGIVDLKALDAIDDTPNNGAVVHVDVPGMDYTYLVEVVGNNGTETATETVSVTREFLATTEIYNSPKPRYNVLFIITDDLNCDLGTYDHPLVQSPNIDSLAASGRQFDRAYCQWPVCWPSRKSFMTGLYPDPINASLKNDPVRNENPRTITMSQHFMASGYQVDRVGKIYHYDVPASIGEAGSDDPQSWLRWYAPSGRDKTIENQIIRVSSLNPNANNNNGLGAQISWLSDDHDNGQSDLEQTDGLVVLQANSLLSEYASSDTPFFLAVGLFRPHTPFVFPSQYIDPYDLDDISVPTIPSGYLNSIPSQARSYVRNFASDNDLDPEVAKQAIQAYYATISFVDANVGRLLSQLDSLGLRDNTIVVFTSDHGYHMGEHGHYQKKTLYENATRVPLIISVPGQPNAGVRTESYVEMIDFYRTLSDLAGLPEPYFPKGVSLEPIINDPTISVRDSAFSQIDSNYSIRMDQWRYTKYSNGDFELYDHTTDADELVNLAGDSNYSAIVATLDAKLQERIADSQEAKPYPSSGREPYLGRPIELPGTLQAEYFDYGGQGLSWNDSTAGGDAWRDTDVDLEPTEDGSFHIGSITDGEWVEYTVDLTSGTYDLTMRSASNQSSPGRVNVYVEEQFVGSLQGSATGGWKVYAETSLAGIAITGAGANTRIRLEMDRTSGGTNAFNIDWIHFDLKQIDFVQWTGNYDGWSITPVDMNADEDGDGFDNKTEFLFGGNPLSSLSTPAITYFKDDQDQEFSASLYVQDSAQEGNFSWQWARDLTTGSWFTSGFEQTDTDIPNGMIRSQILLDTSQEPQVFLRGIFE